MAADISNRTLAMFLVAAIVVSVFGTFISLNRLSGLQGSTTGMGWGAGTESTGTAEVTILENTEIEVISDVNFGTIDTSSGWVGIGSITLDTDTDNSLGQDPAWSLNDCTIEDTVSGDHSNDCRGIEVRNIGTTIVDVSMTSSETATTLFGGSLATPAFQTMVIDGDLDKGTTGGCVGVDNQNAAWREVTLAEQQLCHDLEYGATNTFTVEVSVTIPEDTFTAQRIATLTFNGVKAT